MEIKFKIDHIDPMGQGVYKEGDQIYFIPKTLPQEEGIATVINKSKGVHFCQLKSIEVTAKERANPDCHHYSECQGCHYLHTDYENEISFKLNTLQRILNPYLGSVKISVIPSTKRFGNRNRIQLHYNRHFSRLGFIEKNNREILPVPNCRLPNEKVKLAMDHLYQRLEAEQKKFFPQNKPIGHIEIYDQGEEKTAVHWNRPYAFGGFSQVNPPMNKKIQEKIRSIVDEISSLNQKRELFILDFFGGSGNLTKNLHPHQALILDTFIARDKLDQHQKGLIINLQNSASTKLIQEEIGEKKVDMIILDPPRSGMKNIETILLFNSPQIIYISCSPQTLARDLSKLKDYRIEMVELFDFFPGTFHFETLIFLKKIVQN